MPSVEMIHQMLDYNYTLQTRLWDSIMTLTDAQFVEPVPYSIGSIHHHMVHLADVDRSWLRDLMGMPEAPHDRYRPEDHPTRECVRSLCAEAAIDLMTYAIALDDADLTRQPSGLSLTVWQVLLHVVNHGTDHRAQVLRALHDLGAPTFDQDLSYHLTSRC
ncbi:MAG: hypothetical protein CL610_26640 [Anaerolineaceae bacterium]|nr:hypothetical protein [Anaerolineaceae bacterium]